ncbi:MAG: hypothetical protein L0213_09175 [Candidatus Dadabacteria bacterium]|nr:hypothetical protein [Candidatus Dadabacteria bacterium]
MSAGFMKAFRKSWHVIIFLFALMFSMIFVAAYTPALPLVLILWIIVPVVAVQLWRRIRSKK